jgi:hypothetical protein
MTDEEKLNNIFEFLDSQNSFCLEKYKRNGRLDKQKITDALFKGRRPKHPTSPTTESDPAVIDVLTHYFNYKAEQSNTLELIHKNAMVAEKIVGDILERYIASILEPKGWIWCTGSIIKSVDFIRKNHDKWELLQIKNRDNSENSSSKAIRNGTSIKHWFRTFSRKKQTNWENFPDSSVTLSEEGFRRFLIDYIEKCSTTKSNPSAKN